VAGHSHRAHRLQREHRLEPYRVDGAPLAPPSPCSRTPSTCRCCRATAAWPR
jgi:hypothetical protein